MKILRRPGMPSETKSPAPLKVRRQAAEIIHTGRYDEEELEDALVLIGGYLWAASDDEEDVDDVEEGEEDEGYALESRISEFRARRRGVEEPWFIGRQIPAGDAGTLDLIGPQRNGVEGALTIYELKAREIRPADLAQVESYRVALEELSADDLAWTIATNSGRQGIPRNWYPDSLRWAILSAQDEELDFPLNINCTVIGRAWKRPVSRLANSMGIKLIHIPELISTALEGIAKTERNIAKMAEMERRLEAIEEEEEG